MVYFVGAGCGAADLITVRGMRLLESADVIIYAGSLVNPELLSYAGKECRIYNSARLTLEEVVGIMKRAEEEGKMTVRLHTGEPSIYGAVREQMDELDKAGIAYESCPGVSACFGAAASLNLEYTLPGVSQTLILTRMEGKTEVPKKESIESLAAHGASMAIYLSAGMLEELSRRLIKGGYGKSSPAALVYKASWPEEEVYLCTVETLYDTAAAHNITKTAIVLVGDALMCRHYQRSKLYHPDYSTEFRSSIGKECGSIGKDMSWEWGMEEKRQNRENMTLSMISFTERGIRLSEEIRERLTGWEGEIGLFTKCRAVREKKQGNGSQAAFVEVPVSEWAGEQMDKGNGVLFIGACGIAVRAIAPHLRGKLQDSPVLVMDEEGRYVIPILSGHVGGANELAAFLGKKTGAKPVLTTATDINGKFAVDVFAEKNGLFIENKEGIAKVSAKLLAGEEITVSIEPGYEKALVWGNKDMPLNDAGVRILSYPPDATVDVLIASREAGPGEGRHGAALYLRPKEYVVGIGCKKGKGEAEIENFIQKRIEELGISIMQIGAAASISQKKGEPGIVSWCRKKRIPFFTYTAEELQEAEGDFTESAFVKSKMGIGNVCERAAVKACGRGGKLIAGKCAEEGMTIAVAKKERAERFGGEKERG